MADLIEQHLSQIDALCRRHGVQSLGVFGSAVRGELRRDSDVDLLIEFKPDARIGLLELQEIQAEFERILGRPVDLAGRSILRNPYRRRAILRELRPVYGA